MKITMLTLMAGPTGVRTSGETYDVSADEAKALIDGGFAEEAKPSAKLTASAKPEAATRKGARKAAKPEADAEAEED